MRRALSIAIEPAKALPAAAEVKLLLVALSQYPDSPALLAKAGRALNELDRFEEAIALLAPRVDKLDYGAALELARACFSSADPKHLDLAVTASDRARLAATSRAESARAMAEKAKAQLRQGQDDAAIATLRKAIALDPSDVATFKRLAIQLMMQGEMATMEAMTRDLIADGIHHSRILAARTIALTAMGRIEEARAFACCDRFPYLARLQNLSQAGDLEQFNAELVAELTGHLAMRFDRFGTASLHTARLDSPMESTPIWFTLLQQLALQIEDWANTLPDEGHPWLAARPERAWLRSWCLLTGAAGHEQWHMHPDGWLSGGYYPLVPAGMDMSGEKSGCIAFGLPPGLPGAEAARHFGERAFLPEAGQLMLFPSHLYHRTYPHGAATQRICIAFDIIPA